MALTYLNFDIRLERSAAEYKVYVRTDDGASISGSFTLPFQPFELDNFLLRMGAARRTVRGGPREALTEQFGSRLYQALFKGPIGNVFSTTLARTEAAQMGLRLRFRLNDAAELADVPWEFLFDPSLRRFLAQSDFTPIVRYLELPQPPRALEIHPPVKILAMVASPSGSGYPPLDAKRELDRLADALAHLPAGQVTIDRLPAGTRSALQRQLRRDDYHVFHFIGHGGFDTAAGDGILILEDEDGKESPATARELAAILQNERMSLRLVVLNACEGARPSRTDPFAGTAQTLVTQGVPAVIAMQFEISDQASIAFAHEFYGALADGFPADRAMAQARLALSAPKFGAEWGTPVLYLRTTDGTIFDVSTAGSRPGAVVGSDVRPLEDSATAYAALEFKATNYAVHCVFARQASLGRSSQCDLAFPRASNRVSNLHARLYYDAAHQAFFIEDLRSQNHTYVGGAVAAKPTQLRAGSIVSLAGDLQFTVDEVEGPSPALALIYCSDDGEELARYILVAGTEVGVGTDAHDLVRLPRAYEGRSAGTLQRLLLPSGLRFVSSGPASLGRPVLLRDGVELALLNVVARVRVRL